LPNDFSFYVICSGFQGGNLASYKIPDLGIEIRFVIYLYDQDTRLVITDIDGTITESDTRGFLYPQLGIRADHNGVVMLLDSINEMGYTVMYLTARSMGTDGTTREYLFKVSAAFGRKNSQTNLCNCQTQGRERHFMQCTGQLKLMGQR
jgi:phosphatidate phosphatase PAH1